MPKYLIKGSYTQEGLSGLVKDGGSKRRATVEKVDGPLNVEIISDSHERKDMGLIHLKIAVWSFPFLSM
mgnify:CR=1 FL=1